MVHAAYSWLIQTTTGSGKWIHSMVHTGLFHLVDLVSKKFSCLASHSPNKVDIATSGHQSISSTVGTCMVVMIPPIKIHHLINIVIRLPASDQA